MKVIKKTIDSDKKKTIEKVAENHIKLGILLKKKRPPEKKEIIQKILRSELPLTEKIKKIERIDKEDLKPIRAEEESLHKDADVTCAEARLNRRRIKQNLQRQRFFRYVFAHYFKIKKFGKKTHIISSSIFPFSLRLNADVRHPFSEYLKIKYAKEILAALDIVEKIGWRYLTKFVYNLIINFKGLCLLIQSVDFYKLDYKNQNLVDKLSRLENAFLLLIARSEYTEIILKGICQVLEREDSEVDLVKKEECVRAILSRDLCLPSVYNFILGLNMVKYRQYLEKKDLIRAIYFTISHSEYDCSDEIQQEINLYLQSCIKDLLPLLDLKNRAHEVKAFLPADATENIDYRLLENFYNTGFSQEGYEFKKDQENVALLAPRIFRLYLQSFQDLLNNTVVVQGSGDQAIFERSFFETEFTRLAYFLDRLDKLSLSIIEFPRSRYIRLKNINRDVIHLEADILATVQEILNVILGIAKQLAEIIHNRSADVNNEAAPLAFSEVKHKRFRVPHANSRLVSGKILQGKTVFEALSYISSLSFLLSLYLYENSLFELLEKEEGIRDKINTLLENIERIADKNVYLDLKRRYQI